MALSGADCVTENDPGPAGLTRLLRWTLIVLLSMAVAAMLAELLRAAMTAFLNLEYSRYSDYAKYTNMLWNTAHGRLFAWGTGESYLATHLSFSLALIAPLFRLWDHPALLLVVQWGFLAGGGLFLMAAGFRHRIDAILLLSVLIFFTAYHFTQDVMLREFHGVSAYFLLVPMLYYCAAFRRRMAWIPVLLIAGLREEAGLVAMPVLLYFAVTGKWKAGYGYAGAMTLYAILACLVLFPWINGHSIADRRHTELANACRDLYFGATAMKERAISFGWILLPLVAFLKPGWKPILAFLLVPVLLTLGSPEPSQYRMEHHYPAVVAAFMSIGMLHVAGASARGGRQKNPRPWLAAACLLAVTAVSFHIKGLVVGSVSAQTSPVYRTVSGPGPYLLHVALHHVPGKGVMTAPREFRSLLANRRDLRWSRRRAVAYNPDVVLALGRNDAIEPALTKGLSNGTWRIVHSDAAYTLFQRADAPPR